MLVAVQGLFAYTTKNENIRISIHPANDRMLHPKAD